MNHPDGNIKLLVLVGISVMLLLFVSFLLIFISTQCRKFRYQRNLQQLREKQQQLLIEAAVKSEESAYLQKPFTSQELLVKVKQVLANSGSSSVD